MCDDVGAKASEAYALLTAPSKAATQVFTACFCAFSSKQARETFIMTCSLLGDFFLLKQPIGSFLNN